MFIRQHIYNILDVLRFFQVSREFRINRYSTTVKAMGPVEQAITSVLHDRLRPIYLKVINESFMHNVPKDSETHFKVLVVSEKFDELPLIKRHRMINAMIKEQLSGNFVHALSIEAKTPKQWDPKYKVESSPKCLGGFGK